jgi:hypothetical protein
MTAEEMIAILEEIARGPDAYPTSRVTALRTLWEWSHAEPEEEPNPFAELYDTDEPRVRRRVARKRENRN